MLGSGTNKDPRLIRRMMAMVILSLFMLPQRENEFLFSEHRIYNKIYQELLVQLRANPPSFIYFGWYMFEHFFTIIARVGIVNCHHINVFYHLD